MKNFFIFIFIVFLTMVLSGVAIFFLKNKKQDSSLKTTNKLSVVATFYPLAFVAKQIGGNAVQVASIVKGGIEPHDYDPSTNDILNIYNADVFVVNGGGVDLWAEKIKHDVLNRGVKLITASEVVKFNKLKDKNNNDTVGFDSHFWLDPVLFAEFASILTDKFVELMPDKKDIFYNNKDLFIKKMNNIDIAFKKVLASCRQNNIVVSHNAFGYWAKRYGIKILSIAGLSPHNEPSLKKISELYNIIKDKDIKYIFFEELASPRLVQNIAEQAGVTTLSLNPIEGLLPTQVNNGINYFNLMEKNLMNLAIAMQCVY